MNLVSRHRLEMFFKLIIEGRSIRSACRQSMVSKATTAYWFRALHAIAEDQAAIVPTGRNIVPWLIAHGFIDGKHTIPVTLSFFCDAIDGWHGYIRQDATGATQ